MRHYYCAICRRYIREDRMVESQHHLVPEGLLHMGPFVFVPVVVADLLPPRPSRAFRFED